MNWKITFIDSKVESQALSLPSGILANFLHIAELVESFGPQIGMPYTRRVETGLYEIRLKGKEGIARLFYCCPKGRKLVVLSVFVKKIPANAETRIEKGTTTNEEGDGMSRPTFEEFRDKALKRPGVKAEYDRLSPAYKLRRRLIEIRKAAGFTQEKMAEALQTQKSNISRLENVNSKSSPTLSTIERYARAAGYRVEITFFPE